MGIRFEFELLPKRNLAELTLKDYKKKLIHIRKALGEKITDELSVHDISSFLDTFPLSLQIVTGACCC